MIVKLQTSHRIVSSSTHHRYTAAGEIPPGPVLELVLVLGPRVEQSN